MPISGVSGSDAAAIGPERSSQGRSPMEGLGEDAFLMLLLAQLKNQDPLQPMEDKDFIAQLAQFNSLSQLTQLNQTITELMAAQTLTQGSALIGKVVSGLTADGQPVTGLVAGLSLVDSKVMLAVDGWAVPLERVHSVQMAPAEG